jgi:hypothetical protein
MRRDQQLVPQRAQLVNHTRQESTVRSPQVTTFKCRLREPARFERFLNAEIEIGNIGYELRVGPEVD